MPLLSDVVTFLAKSK